jgi:DNA-binding transcriptional regulator GbsR (MarR family)
MPKRVNISDAKTGEAALDQAVSTFVQGAGKVSSALLGMINKAQGQIYALLFISDEPLSLDEISDRLGISKSNVSINIRMLEDFNLVRKVWVKGSRKDYYSAERVYPKKVLRDFLEKIKKTMEDAIITIERTRAKTMEAKILLDGKGRERIDFILSQLNLIGLFYYAANNFFDDFFSGKPINVDTLRHAILNPEDFHPKGQKNNDSR